MKKAILLKAAPIFFLSLFGDEVLAQTNPTEEMIENKEFSLPDPTRYEAYYDIKTGMYHLYPKIGNMVVGAPVVMTAEQYSQYLQNKQVRDYYLEKADSGLAQERDREEKKRKGILPSITIKNKWFETIFGGNKIELIPQGYASFDLGILSQKIDNPLVLPQNRQSFNIDLQQRLNFGILGKVGENLQLRANYDTQSGFAFENRMNLIWQAGGSWKDLQSKGVNTLQNRLNNRLAKDQDDRIIKKVEFGNINMPLSTNLIRGSESLFGLKTEFQLGKTTGTLVFSQQQGEARNVVVQNGGVSQTFKINAVDYEDNQHFFIGHYFNSHYDNSLAQYPLINSKININRIEVWVIDQGAGNLQNQKSIVAIRDLGEGTSTAAYPDNEQNNLYQSIANLSGIRDVGTAYNSLKDQALYDITQGTSAPYKDGENFIFNRRARKLNDNEFRLNSQLGYISLNQRLNDNQLLAVSFSYTVNGDAKVYKVGEFSEENSSVLITKLLKPNVVTRTTSPMWDLMMKNIYSLNANQISSEDFLMNVYYRDPNSGKVNYLPNTNVRDTTLLRLFNWDRLNLNGDLQQNSNGTMGDGLFDFVPNITIDSDNGKLIFTKTKPFGRYLEEQLNNNDPQFVFHDLYNQQKQVATQSNLAQRYTIEGRYKSSGSQGISLGAINVPQGSVSVSSNGVQLTEGVDYTVDYLLGTVTIINEMIKQSGQPININLENQLTFNTQRKRFLGVNLERKINEHWLVGATAVNYLETPLTQKVQFGQEAVNNTMLGLNMAYSNEAKFLTRLTNKIPLVKTNAPSHINFRAEAAYLIPGQSKNANNQSYIDDFELASSKISLKDPVMWGLASKPEQNTSDPIFSTAGNNNNVSYGYGRGLLSWYYIDPRFYGSGGNAPSGITPQSLSNHASRRVLYSELYNTRDYIAGEEMYLNTLDITYYPKERGPYNLNPSAESTQERWAGMMRPISVSNFVNSNIEYVEFWLMDPYADGGNLGANPKMLLHLGNVSEDVLKDGHLQYENGLPTNSAPANTTSTNWGNQPKQAPVLYAFSSEGADRTAQDVGFDGLNNIEEAQKFGTNFVNPITNELDPAADDFVYYMSNQFQGQLASSLVERYRYFRNPDGNSTAGSLEVSSQMPDSEDINKDYNLDLYESYNQYTINLDRASLALGQNNIVDVKEVSTTFQDGRQGKNKWFLFRIPVKKYDTNAGEASQEILNNVRYARMILKGFDETTTLRLGSFDLVRSDWRKYTKSIAVDNTTTEGFGTIDDSNLEVGSVNLEENAWGTPPYMLPPGIDREVLSGTTGTQRQNESSLSLKVNNLSNEARAVYKNVALDLRRYGKLEMFVHAQDLKDRTSTQLDENTKFFIRFGSDATDNYYEYEASLKYTSANARTPYEIWPTENMISLDLDEFTGIKGRRDKTGANMDSRYTDANFGDANKKIYVKGRPTLGGISTIVIGVRNQDANNVPKDVLLWVNELRASGTENKGGYAANASLNFNLGDFALVNATGAISSVGFGGITEKPSERAQSELSSFHIDTTVNLDKFLPEKLGMRIPLNYSYTQSIEDPKYNPLDNDVELSQSPIREELQSVVRTYTQQRSIGIVNMQKQRTNTTKKARFYDVENLTLTAVYNDDFYRDIYTTKNYRQNLRGYLDYSYNFRPLEIKPFNKIISDTAKSAKYLNWVKEFNINPVPARFSFRTELDRSYNELQYRNIDAILSGITGDEFETMRTRTFYFGWQYNLGFNLTKSLKLDINSYTRTLNDHLAIDEMNRKSIFQNPFRVGRPVLYNHRVQLNYRLPFEYFPYLDFINAELGHGIQYNWSARSTMLTNENLGNLAQNNKNTTLTASADIPSFLKKFNYFQKIDSTMSARKAEISAMENANREVAEKRLKGRKAENNKNYQFKNKLTPMQSLAYALTSIKQVNFNYNETAGIALPGIMSSPNFFGYGTNGGGPTYGFLLGSQADIRRLMIERNWVSASDLMTDAYSEMNTKALTGNIQIQPMNDLRIDLNFLKNQSKTLTQSGYNILINNQLSYANEMLSLSHTDILLGTSFKDGGQLYADLVDNARTLSRTLGQGGVIEPNGFIEGYGLANAYVLVPAFKATIAGKKLNGDNPTKSKFPLPNWQVIYSGLTNIPIVNKHFAKFDLLHGYKATYTASGIQSSTDYYNYSINPAVAPARDNNGNYHNPYIFSQVGYVEEFAPLIGADVTMRNNMQIRAMYNKNRAYVLGVQNYTLTEDSGSEYIFGFGYIIKDLKLRLRLNNKMRDIKSDLNLKFDFSLRDNKTRITNIIQEDSQVTGGQKILGVNFSADYNLSQNFQIKMFYNQLVTKYKISTAYPLSTVRAGLTANFTFGGNNN